MKQYIKNGKIKTRNQIVLRKTRIVNGEEKVFQVINPREEMLLEDGWVIYEQQAPTDEERNLQRTIALKRVLSQSDYKVIKCMEAMLCGEELPYDIKALHEERNRIRAQVNELESSIAQDN